MNGNITLDIPKGILIQRDAVGALLRILMLPPSNFHAHFRWAELMNAVTRHIMANMRYVLAMPNNGEGGVLKTIAEAEEYYRTLLRVAGPEYAEVGVLMTLYNSDLITPAVIAAITRPPIVQAIKCYPGEKGDTTNSGHGIPLEFVDDDTLRAAVDHEVPYLVHGEVNKDRNGTVLPPPLRERYYMTEVLPRIRDRHPNLRLCVEHATTVEAVRFVKADTSGKTVATITPQHLLYTHRDFLKSWGNHLKCMPIAKEEEDVAELVDFVSSGDFRAIAGTDTAPHPASTKVGNFEQAANGCWLPHAISLYALAFERAGKLGDGENFLRFMSLNGPKWWRLAPPNDRNLIDIRRVDDGMPEPVMIGAGPGTVIPLGWSTADDRLKLEFAPTRFAGF